MSYFIKQEIPLLIVKRVVYYQAILRCNITLKKPFQLCLVDKNLLS